MRCNCDLGDKGLSIVHGGWDIIGCGSYDNDYMASGRSVLSGD